MVDPLPPTGGCVGSSPAVPPGAWWGPSEEEEEEEEEDPPEDPGSSWFVRETGIQEERAEEVRMPKSTRGGWGGWADPR